MATYKYYTISGQSVFDLAIQLYGDVSKIGNLIELFPNLNNIIDIGQEITVEVQTDPIAKYFSDNRLKVATDVVDDSLTVDSDLITVDSDLITADQTIG
jgi:hypothetical protein